MQNYDLVQDDIPGEVAPFNVTSARVFLDYHGYTSATGVKGLNIIIMLGMWLGLIILVYVSLKAKVSSAIVK